ncbi:MAG: hypothetical protein HY805_10345 [Nitrospirae bacterium]|nr:hypothetical protein [Nitrospirota bacterium]
MKKFYLALIFVLAIASEGLCGGWIYYTDGPYKGKVVDLETGKPIEGAVVAGVWELALYGSPQGPIPRFCDAKETLTDKNGGFTVPKASCFHLWPFTKLGWPQFVVFKPGYLGYPPIGAAMEERLSRMPDFTGEEFRDKKHYYVIKLGRPKIKEERALTQSNAQPHPFEAYRKLPTLLKLLNEERKNLGLLGEIEP